MRDSDKRDFEKLVRDLDTMDVVELFDIVVASLRKREIQDIQLVSHLVKTGLPGT